MGVSIGPPLKVFFPPSGTLEKAHYSTDIRDRVGLSSEPSSQGEEVSGFGK